MSTYDKQPARDLEEIIDQYRRYDDSEHFPIREYVRDTIACDRTIEQTAAWLKEETQKRIPDAPGDLPWQAIALYFHEDVSERMAYEEAHGL